MLAAEPKVARAQAADSLKANPNCSWNHLVEPLEPFLKAVNQQLTQQVNDFDPQIVPYAQYALNGSGKHLRPMLVALAANAVDKAADAHVKAAVIIEMVHLATLVHDDVMDEAEIRRGQLTLAANWGNEIAVLFRGLSFRSSVEAGSELSHARGLPRRRHRDQHGLFGEILQTQHRRKFQVSRHEYFRVIEMKTAELFTLSCDLAGLLGNARA